MAEGGLLPDSDTDSTGNMALKLLVIDDHPLILEGVAAALEGLGHGVRIVAARTAEKGWRPPPRIRISIWFCSMSRCRA